MKKLLIACIVIGLLSYAVDCFGEVVYHKGHVFFETEQENLYRYQLHNAFGNPLYEPSTKKGKWLVYYGIPITCPFCKNMIVLGNGPLTWTKCEKCGKGYDENIGYLYAKKYYEKDDE